MSEFSGCLPGHGPEGLPKDGLEISPTLRFEPEEPPLAVQGGQGDGHDGGGGVGKMRWKLWKNMFETCWANYKFMFV